VLGNAQRLEQVIINLIQNACESLTNADQALTVSTGWDPGNQQVTLVVIDQGRGMDPEVLPRITEPFFTTRPDRGGTGLGLSIAASIIKEHHGTLTFSSTPGQGTTATVSLPQMPEH
jgi:polar amino acid transport system substrate-binding protein